jgi:hypothetical protein
MGKDLYEETMSLIGKAHEMSLKVDEGPTEEEIASFKKELDGLSEEEKVSFVKKLQEKLQEESAVRTGKRLRMFAYGSKEICLPTPSDKAIFRAYPLVSENFFVTLLTLGFNTVVNKRREKEFEEKDKNDFAATGTTAALRIDQDKGLQKRDKEFIEMLKYQETVEQELRRR